MREYSGLLCINEDKTHMEYTSYFPIKGGIFVKITSDNPKLIGFFLKKTKLGSEYCSGIKPSDFRFLIDLIEHGCFESTSVEYSSRSYETEIDDWND